MEKHTDGRQEAALESALLEAFRSLIETAARQNITLSACESFTGGLFCACAASIPGASQVLQGGIVSYQNTVKENLAGVPASLIEQYSAVSVQCAMSMAEETRKKIPSTWCVSFTGNAGPDPSEGKPAGELYMALAAQERTIPFCLHCDPLLDRNQIRQSAVLIMALLLTEAAKDPETGLQDFPAGQLIHLQLHPLQKQ